ncbi:RNA polymerase sigma factor [Streptococcus canis]
MSKKEFYLYVKGKKISVNEEVYKTYWKSIEHEKYLRKLDRKNKLILFSELNHDGHFEDNLQDNSIDVEKIVVTHSMIETTRKAISKLSEEEKDIIIRLYFMDETVRSVAKSKGISHPALIKKRNKILEKLRRLIEDF